MSNRTTPTDVNLTYYSTSTLPAVAPGTYLVGSASQYQVYSDRAVWDSTNNKYLYPGVDFLPYPLFGD
jgi:hypothetical protein